MFSIFWLTVYMTHIAILWMNVTSLMWLVQLLKVLVSLCFTVSAWFMLTHPCLRSAHYLVSNDVVSYEWQITKHLPLFIEIFLPTVSGSWNKDHLPCHIFLSSLMATLPLEWQRLARVSDIINIKYNCKIAWGWPVSLRGFFSHQILGDQTALSEWYCPVPAACRGRNSNCC